MQTASAQTARADSSSSLDAALFFFFGALAARIPVQDSYFLRAASYDSPAEGLSAFAVEMLDVATILRDATRQV
jgi:DNA mismatch repair ATPase MutS